MKKLSVILDGARHPHLNMALDYTLLESRALRGEAVLRLYTWLPPGVSLGRRQEARGTVNVGEASRRGYVVVKRPTGGATLLHETFGELTYSLVLPASSQLYQASIEESSSIIAGAVAEALRVNGVPARVGGFQGVGREENICLLRSGFADIVVDGRKVSGSAQYRSSSGLLQHGSILLEFNPETWLALVKSESSIIELVEHVAGLWDLGYRVDRAGLAVSIAASVSSLLGLPPVYSYVHPREMEKALELVARGRFNP